MYILRDIPQYGGNMHDSTYGAKEGGNSSDVNPSLLSSGVKNIYIQLET